MQLRTRPALSCVIMHLSKHVEVKLVNGDSLSNSTGKETVVPRDQNLQLSMMAHVLGSGLTQSLSAWHTAYRQRNGPRALNCFPTDRGPSGARGPRKRHGTAHPNQCSPTWAWTEATWAEDPRGGRWGRTWKGEPRPGGTQLRTQVLTDPPA